MSISTDKAVVLYRKSSIGSMMVWRIEPIDNTIVIRYGMMDGSHQTQTERVERGLAGRTLDQQIQSRIDSRVNKQLDKGYRYSIEEARSLSNCNALNLYKPMLAQSYKRVKVRSLKEYYAQYKYDGHRCLIVNDGGELRAYTRRGKWITTIGHILKDMVNVPDGMTIDGELYHHCTSLQTISSWTKRAQPDTLKLKYMAYDIVMDRTYLYRHRLLTEMFKGFDNVVVAPTGRIKDSLNESLLRSRSQGYEGLILRHADTLYEPGKRSQGLIKVKSLDDVPMIEIEAVVVDVKSSRDGWGVLSCLTPNGQSFDTSAPGSIEFKRTVLVNKEDYIGRSVTVQFPNYTDEGRPFHAVALRFRDDL